MKFILFVFLLFSSLIGLSQVTVEWEDFLLSSGNVAQTIVKDSEERLYVYASNHLMRYGHEGDTIWHTSTGLNIVDFKIDHEDNLVLSYRTFTDGIGYQWGIQKRDSVGEIIWNTIIGASPYHQPRKLCVDEYDNVYVTGMLYYRLGVLKLNKFGQQQWLFDSNIGNSTGYDIVAKDSNNIYVTGEKQDYSYLLKLNGLGDTVWTRTFRRSEWLNSSLVSYDRGLSVLVDNNGDVVMQNRTLTLTKTQTVKYDSNGNLLWVKEFFPDEFNQFSKNLIDTNNNIYTVQSRQNSSNQWSIYVHKIASNSTMLWSHQFINEDYDQTKALGAFLFQNKLYVSGATSVCNGCDQAHIVFHLEEDGTKKWEYKKNTPAWGNFDVSNDLLVTQDSMIYVTGCGAPPGQTSEYVYTYKLKPCPEIDYSVRFENDTIFANSEGFTYTLLHYNNGNFVPIWINLSTNYFMDLSLGTYKVITDAGPCGLDTSDIIITGYTTNVTSAICSGSSFTFSDGFFVSNVTTTTFHMSELTSQTNLDSIVNHVLIPVPTVDTTIIRVDDSLHVANFQGLTTFQWINCSDNSVVSGANASSFSTDIPGFYASIINQQGCIDTTSCYLIGNLSSNELKQALSQTIFPNPSSDYITFDGELNYPVQIQDINGKRIHTDVYFIENDTIDIQQLNAGMYFLMINGKSYKFVKN